MPDWSPLIANEFIRLGIAERRCFDQMQLQKLVYIAHGWCLAYSAQPLTGDRPEAWSFGPVYRRLSDALASSGLKAVHREVTLAELYPAVSSETDHLLAKAEVDEFETDVIAMVYKDFGCLDGAQLSSVTQGPASPWAKVFAAGAGSFKDIPHQLIRDQFLEYARA